jgi:hypothetical protein
MGDCTALIGPAVTYIGIQITKETTEKIYIDTYISTRTLNELKKIVSNNTKNT